MTRQETQELLFTISALYPNFTVPDKSITVDAWYWALHGYTVEQAKAALMIYVKTSNTGWAPSASQLIGCIHAPKNNDQLSEGEAWALVKKAIQDGNYHAEERFNELPELVRRAVGGAGMIRQWAQTDSDEVNTVIMSNFQRTYKAILAKQDFNNKVPPQIADVVRGTVERLVDHGS